MTAHDFLFVYLLFGSILLAVSAFILLLEHTDLHPNQKALRLLSRTILLSPLWPVVVPFVVVRGLVRGTRLVLRYADVRGLIRGLKP